MQFTAEQQRNFYELDEENRSPAEEGTGAGGSGDQDGGFDGLKRDPESSSEEETVEDTSSEEETASEETSSEEESSEESSSEDEAA